MNTLPLFQPEVHQKLKFPARQDKAKATWWPIYLEPMIGSGERICVGIAVADENRGAFTRVAGLDRLRHLYGKEHADFLEWTTDEIADSLNESLRIDGLRAFDSWIPPWEGFHLGDPRQSAANTLEEIARAGLTLTASLMAKISEESDSAGDNYNRTKLEAEIKKKVAALDPRMELFFERKRRIGPDARAIEFGYASNQTAANFAVLNPLSLSSSIDIVKSKMYDLGNLKINFNDEMYMTNIKNHLMFIYTPEAQAPYYTDRQMQAVAEAVREFEVESEQKEIYLSADSNTQNMAQTLVEYERLRVAA